MPRSTPRHALPPAAAVALVALLPVALTGCSEAELSRFVEGLAMLVLAVLVVLAVVYGVLLTVLVTNIVHMLRKTPSLGWGVTSCVCGGLVALSALPGLFSGDGLSTHGLGPLVLAGALGWVGQKNVRDAQRRAAERDADVAIPPPAAPPGAPTPPAEQPPRTLAPPWP